MTHSCRNCGRTFSSELDLSLHRDTCVENTLVCRRCGERFDQRRSTTDGWTYRCPNEDCEGAGVGEDLRRLAETPLVR